MLIYENKVKTEKIPIETYSTYTLYQVYAIREDGTKEPIYKECENK